MASNLPNEYKANNFKVKFKLNISTPVINRCWYINNPESMQGNVDLSRTWTRDVKIEKIPEIISSSGTIMVLSAQHLDEYNGFKFWYKADTFKKNLIKLKGQLVLILSTPKEWKIKSTSVEFENSLPWREKVFLQVPCMFCRSIAPGKCITTSWTFHKLN